MLRVEVCCHLLAELRAKETLMSPHLVQKSMIRSKSKTFELVLHMDQGDVHNKLQHPSVIKNMQVIG